MHLQRRKQYFTYYVGLCYHNLENIQNLNNIVRMC